jgi:hypothetical protein
VCTSESRCPPLCFSKSAACGTSSHGIHGPTFATFPSHRQSAESSVTASLSGNLKLPQWTELELPVAAGSESAAVTSRILVALLVASHCDSRIVATFRVGQVATSSSSGRFKYHTSMTIPSSGCLQVQVASLTAAGRRVTNSTWSQISFT